MTETSSTARDPIRLGLVADQTGPLSFVGLANANVARMVVGDINAKGGLLGRPLELHVEDGATDDAVAAEAATRLVHAEVDVVFGGIYSSTRQAIKGPVVVEGKTLYLYPEQYEGQESDPLIFCTGPVPAQQVDPFIPWLMRETGARTFYLPSADYIWPHVLNARVRAAVTANGGSIVGEEHHPLDHMDYAATVERIMASGADVVFNTIVPPGVSPFFESLYEAGFTRGGGHLVCTYFDENFLNMVPAAHVEGLYSCLDYYQAVRDPFSEKLLGQYEGLYPGDAKFTGGSGCSGLYRAIRLWATAVTEAGTLEQSDVVAALDHAEIVEGPGGPAAMVPGQHHLRLQMYIAQARDGRFEIVESLGAIDPREREVEIPVTAWTVHHDQPPTTDKKESHMLLATTQVEDFDRFLDVFSNAGADKRREHGSEGAVIFRDPNEADRVWVIFDWDAEGWHSFVSDPEVPPIMKEAGHKSKPVAAELAARCDA